MASTDNACAACGNKGDQLKLCTACKMVRYCGVDCQRSHRKAHKDECNMQALRNFTPPPSPTCAICMLPMPLTPIHNIYLPCCGKSLCHGCTFESNKMHHESGTPRMCPFCRQKWACSCCETDALISQLEKRADMNDADAMEMLAMKYCKGDGVERDDEKALALLKSAADAGCLNAICRLGMFYRNGIIVEPSEKDEIYYTKKAANAGNTIARQDLARVEGLKGNYEAMMLHFWIAAKGGSKESLDALKEMQPRFPQYITEEELAATISAYESLTAEIESEERARAEEHEHINRN